MNSRLKDYLINTILGQIFFILVLSPWFIFIIGMSFEQYITWLWQGSLIGLVLPHGMIMWVGFWKKRFVQHSWKVSWLLAQVSYSKNTSTISTTSTFARLSVVLGSLGGDIISTFWWNTSDTSPQLRAWFLCGGDIEVVEILFSAIHDHNGKNGFDPISSFSWASFTI